MKSKITLHPQVIKDARITTYDFSNLKMTFCTAPDKKDRIRFTNYLDSCRETVAHFLRNQIENGPEPGREVIDLKRTRLIFYLKSNNESSKQRATEFAKTKDKQISESLKIVNYLEKKHGWLLTKVSKVNVTEHKLRNSHGNNVGENINMYMIVGSNKWLRSPHTLSLYMLLLRAGTREFKGNFKTHEEFISGVKAFASSNKSKFNDAKYIGGTCDMWDIILKNHGKLFKNKTINRLYNSKHLVNECNGFNEGIQRLCTGYSYDLEISKRFVELCKSNGITNISCLIKEKKERKETQYVGFDI